MKNILNFKTWLAGLMFHKPRTAAQDYVIAPATWYAGPGAGMAHLGNYGSTLKPSNHLFDCELPFNDSVCGKKRIVGLFTRTTPVDDTEYAGYPVGSICLFQTVASTVVTDAAVYLKTIDGFSKFITSGGDNQTIDAVATSARAASSWYGLRLKSRAATGIAITGNQAALYIETELTGTATCSGSHYGIKIETYVESDATVTGDHYGIAIFTYSDIAGNQSIDCIRLEHNGASVARGFMNIQAAANKMRYLWTSSTVDDTWMSITTTPTCGTAGGWLRVKHGGYTRYIQLWTSIS